MTKLAMFGADPEILVVNGGKIAHCIGLLGGTKEKPFRVEEGAVQEDNVAFEFNIDPTSDRKVFLDRIQKVMAQGLNILGKDFEFSKAASHVFTADELKQMPPQAMVFGCDPDYNALTGDVNPAPRAMDPGLRSAGGHVHIGFGKDIAINEDNQRLMGVLCDYYLGLPSLILDTDERRRELYGKAGAIRKKDAYGMEYRTLSNFWIHKKDDTLFVFDQAKKAHDNFEAFFDLAAQFSPERVQEVINTNNKRMAEQMIKTMGLC